MLTKYMQNIHNFATVYLGYGGTPVKRVSVNGDSTVLFTYYIVSVTVTKNFISYDHNAYCGISTLKFAKLVVVLCKYQHLFISSNFLW